MLILVLILRRKCHGWDVSQALQSTENHLILVQGVVNGQSNDFDGESGEYPYTGAL